VNLTHDPRARPRDHEYASIGRSLDERFQILPAFKVENPRGRVMDRPEEVTRDSVEAEAFDPLHQVGVERRVDVSEVCATRQVNHLPSCKSGISADSLWISPDQR